MFFSCALVKIMHTFPITSIVHETATEICSSYIKLSIPIGFGNYKLHKIGNAHFSSFIFFKLAFQSEPEIT